MPSLSPRHTGRMWNFALDCLGGEVLCNAISGLRSTLFCLLLCAQVEESPVEQHLSLGTRRTETPASIAVIAVVARLKL